MQIHCSSTAFTVSNIHTIFIACRHPIELTEVLQGFDIPQQGTHGPRCSVFSKHVNPGLSGGTFRDNDRSHFLQLLRKTLGSTSRERLGDVVGVEDNEADALWRELWADSEDAEDSGFEAARVVGHQQLANRGWAGWWSDLTGTSSTGVDGDRFSSPGSEGGEEDGYCERWEDMVSEVNLFFEWSIVNRLNKVEWLLLGKAWGGRECLFTSTV